MSVLGLCNAMHDQQVAVRGIVSDHGNNTHKNPESSFVLVAHRYFAYNQTYFKQTTLKIK